MARRLQFTLRRWFAWVALASVVVWLGSGLLSVATIKMVGGDFNEDKTFISGTSITDSQFRFIASDPTLRVLWACRTKLGDDGMKHLRWRNGVEAVFLDGTLITDEGLETLATIRTMHWIGANDTQVSDSGLAAISRLPSLERLDLQRTQVTDAGLRHLEQMPSLIAITLEGSQVTAEGVGRLRRALPGCQVVWER